MPEDKPSWAYVPRELRKEFEAAQSWIYDVMNNSWSRWSAMLPHKTYYAIDTAHPEAREHFPQICEAMTPELKENDWVVYVGGDTVSLKNGEVYQVEGVLQWCAYLKVEDTKPHEVILNNVRPATDEEIEVHLRSMLPDWLQVGKKIRFDGDVFTITRYYFSKDEDSGVCINTLDYIEKYGYCLEIEAECENGSVAGLPFGAVWDDKLCNYEPVKERYEVHEDDEDLCYITDTESGDPLSLKEVVKLLNEKE